jgi:CDP-diacylglycerol---glycerol-3-phosphate 3-phosphatidyltransferase
MTAPPRSTEVVAVNGLYALKPWYARRLGSIVDVAVARGVSPDVFSVIGVAGAVVAGVGIARGWWLMAAAGVAVRLGGANLDGAVAQASGGGRPRGFVVNELGDRAADLVLFGGLVILAVRVGSGWTSLPVLVTAAALAATLPTFVSLTAAAASGDVMRLNGGPVGKTERCALAVLAAAVPSWLAAIAMVIIVGSLVTATMRLASAWRELQ